MTKIDVEAFKALENPTPDEQMAAVKQQRNLIRSIKNPTPEVQMYAVKKNSNFFKHIKNPDPSVVAYMQKKDSYRQHFGKKRFLPKHLSSDQMSIIRFMEKNDIDSISVRDVKKNFNQSNIITDMIKHFNGKDLSIDDIISFRPQTKHNDLIKYVKDNHHIEYIEWDGQSQRIFRKHTNDIMLFVVDLEDFKTMVGAFTNEEDSHISSINLISAYSENMSHPYPEERKGKLTAGWVRYTKIDDDIWIDEIQTDLTKPKVTGPEASKEFKNLEQFILDEFVRQTRRRGAGRILVPTVEIKDFLYDSDAPRSVYTNVPKKSKFKLHNVGSIDLPDTITDVVSSEYDVWILESKQSFKDFIG